MEHSQVYGAAELYDIAFSFKDVAAEAETLIELHHHYGDGYPESFLDIAAGPGANAREMARRGLRTVALDLSPGMIAFARDRAVAEGLEIEFIEADMTDFSIPAPVDLAAIFMGSITVLLDNESVIRHLRCVADALTRDGLYVLEMEHPRDVFGVGTSAGTDWEMERDGTTVHMAWGRKDDDPFDPITQITQTTVTVTWERGGERGEIVEVLPNRIFLVNEFRALVRASRRFEIVIELGSLDVNVPFSNEKEAWRYVPVLRKIR